MHQNSINSPVEDIQKSSPNHNKKIIFILLVVVVVLMIGWAAKSFLARQTAEKMAERAIERATGGRVDIDYKDNDTVTYKSDEGSFQAGEDVSLPSDWPSDVPVISGAKIGYAGSTNPQTGQAGVSVMFTISKSVVDVSAYYNSELASQGWEIEGTANMGGTSIITANKGERSVGIYIGGADGMTSVTISLNQ